MQKHVLSQVLACHFKRFTVTQHMDAYLLQDNSYRTWIPNMSTSQGQIYSKLNLNLFSRFDVEIYRGVRTVFSTVFIGSIFPCSCVLTTSCFSRPVRPRKRYDIQNQIEHATSQLTVHVDELGQEAGELNSQELPVGWNQKPRTSRHLLRNFLANRKPWPMYRFTYL